MLGNPFRLMERETLTIIVTSKNIKSQTCYSGYQKEIEFSSENPEAAIYKKSGILTDTSQTFELIKTEKGWMTEPGFGQLYLNGKRAKERTFLEIGDVLFFPFMAIRIIEEDLFQIESFESYESKLPITIRPQSEMAKKYPLYRRTPRMIYEMPDEKVSYPFLHRSRMIPIGDYG